jgi:hypothetical protein
MGATTLKPTSTALKSKRGPSPLIRQLAEQVVDGLGLDQPPVLVLMLKRRGGLLPGQRQLGRSRGHLGGQDALRQRHEGRAGRSLRPGTPPPAAQRPRRVDYQPLQPSGDFFRREFGAVRCEGDRGSLPTRAAQAAIISAKVGQLITIGTYGTRDEAEIVQGLLASFGIDASVRADDAGGAYPFVLSGGAQVLVDESDATAAAEILANRTEI